MYWACFQWSTGLAAVIYSATDPMDRDETWDESYPYDTRAEAEEALTR